MGRNSHCTTYIVCHALEDFFGTHALFTVNCVDVVVVERKCHRIIKSHVE